jgi:hypothetical protein
LRYQWFGYWKEVDIDYTAFSVNSILDQLGVTIDHHMKMAGNDGYVVQDFQISPNELFLTYRGYNKKHTTYVLYVTIDRTTNKACLSISKSPKSWWSEIEPEEWKFELDYFSAIFGKDCGYKFNHSIDKDELMIYENDGVRLNYISGNLYDGSYKLVMSFPR